MAPRLAGMAMELGRKVLSVGPVYRQLAGSRTPAPVASAAVDKSVSRVWVSVRRADGQEREAWMETGEGFEFTALAVARTTIAVLGGGVTARGALTPAMAFGAEWLSGFPGTVVHEAG